MKLLAWRWLSLAALLVLAPSIAGAQGAPGMRSIDPPVPMARGHLYDGDDTYADEYLLEQHGRPYGEPRNLTNGYYDRYLGQSYYDEDFDSKSWSRWFRPDRLR